MLVMEKLEQELAEPLDEERTPDEIVFAEQQRVARENQSQIDALLGLASMQEG